MGTASASKTIVFNLFPKSLIIIDRIYGKSLAAFCNIKRKMIKVEFVFLSTIHICKFRLPTDVFPRSRKRLNYVVESESYNTETGPLTDRCTHLHSLHLITFVRKLLCNGDLRALILK